MKLSVVTPETLYESIDSFVTDNKIKITTYDEMIDTVLKMMKDGFCFSFDRDILRDAMESLTFMYCPGDEMNRDRVVCQLEDVPDEEDDDSESDDGDVDPMSALAGLGGLGGPGGDPMKLMSQLFSGMVDPPKKKEDKEEVKEEVKEEAKEEVKKDECDDCPSKSCEDCPKKEEVKEEDIEVEITDDKSPEEKKEE